MKVGKPSVRHYRLQLQTWLKEVLEASGSWGRMQSTKEIHYPLLLTVKESGTSFIPPPGSGKWISVFRSASNKSVDFFQWKPRTDFNGSSNGPKILASITCIQLSPLLSFCMWEALFLSLKKKNLSACKAKKFHISQVSKIGNLPPRAKLLDERICTLNPNYDLLFQANYG